MNCPHVLFLIIQVAVQALQRRRSKGGEALTMSRLMVKGRRSLDLELEAASRHGGGIQDAPSRQPGGSGEAPRKCMLQHDWSSSEALGT